MFRVTHTPVDSRGLMIVTIIGDANLGAIDQLELEMMRVSAAKPKAIIFDVTGLTFAASLALGCIVAARNGVTQRSGQCVMVGAQGNVADVLKRSKVDTLFVQRTSMDEAMAAVG